MQFQNVKKKGEERKYIYTHAYEEILDTVYSVLSYRNILHKF